MRSLITTSLRWRLITVMCLAYIVVALVTELVSYTTQSQSLRNSLETRAHADATILAAGAEHALVSESRGSYKALETLVHAMQQAEGVSYAAVYSQSDGCLSVPRSPKPAPRCLPSQYQTPGTDTLPNGDELSRVPIGNATAVLGIAVVNLSGSSVQNDLNASLLRDTIIRGIGLVIFLLLSLMIARYLLAPLMSLVNAAGAIRHGRMASRVPVTGRTELATVAEAFNDMASALEQRIKHLSFLAASGSSLPGTFRDKADLDPILAEFCRQLDSCGVGLIPRDDPEQTAIWYDAEPADRDWRGTAAAARQAGDTPTSILVHGRAVMVVPVLGNAIFVAARREERPFSDEEQQVITNFAYQLGIAADNARLFEAQQEALQVKDQFLSIVSHELRTPLTTIKGYAQMLQRRLAGDEDGERFAVNIDSQVSRLGRLVDDLLDVTRFARGQFELRRGRLDLRPLLEDIVARFRVIAPSHTLRLDLEPGAYEGYWDRDRLEQVLNNLVSNAVKYSPQGGEITVRTSHEGDTLTVAVQDQGIGIPEDDQKQLFERFYRGRGQARDVTGLGLGLYVTRRIVEAHGGSISVRSKPQEGSEFSFTLPLARRAVTPAAR